MSAKRRRAHRGPRHEIREASRGGGRLQTVEWAAALVITAVSVGVHIFFFRHAGALWRDEVNTVNTAAAGSLGELWRLMEYESSPLLWILIERAWLAIGAGSGDAGLRVSGLIGGLSVVAAMWFATWRLARSYPLAGLALITINPDIIRWGASLRAWGLGAALAIVAMALVKEASDMPTRQRVAWATLAAILSVQCVFQNAVLLAAAGGAIVIIQLARRDWRAALVPLGIGAAAALSLLPYAGLFAKRSDWNVLAESPVTAQDILDRAIALSATGGPFGKWCWAALPAAAIGVTVFSAGGKKTAALYATVSLLLAAVGLTAFYLTLRLPTQTWYYLGGFAFVAASAETAIAAAAPGRTVAMARAAAALAIVAIGLAPALAALRTRHTNVDVVATELRANASPGDIVLVNPWYFGITLKRYYTGPAAVTTIPPLEDLTIHRYDLIKQRMESDKPLEPAMAAVSAALQAGHRVWLVGSLSAPPAGRSPPSLPRPPLAGTGWNWGPYAQAWAMQMGSFLETHGREGHIVPIEVRGGPFEDAGLSVISGWKDAGATQ